MGKGFGTASEAHALAEVIAPRLAVIAMLAHDACFDRNALTRYEICYPGTNRDNDTCSLVAEDEGGLEGEVAIPPIHIVVN